MWEVEKFGRDSFGDPDAVSLYGMRPAEWYAKGVRILARTALEAVRDALGNRIGADVARAAATSSQDALFGVLDFASPARATAFIRSYGICRGPKESDSSTNRQSLR